ncbi:uncharacterized protein LOC120341036 isoform X1 [Styela clava]
MERDEPHVRRYLCALCECDHDNELEPNCCCPDDERLLEQVSEHRLRRRINLNKDQKLCSTHYKQLRNGLLFGGANFQECCAPFHVTSPKRRKLTKSVPRSWNSYFGTDSHNEGYQSPQRICWECYLVSLEIMNSDESSFDGDNSNEYYRSFHKGFRSASLLTLCGRNHADNSLFGSSSSLALSCSSTPQTWHGEGVAQKHRSDWNRDSTQAYSTGAIKSKLDFHEESVEDIEPDQFDQSIPSLSSDENQIQETLQLQPKKEVEKLDISFEHVTKKSHVKEEEKVAEMIPDENLATSNFKQSDMELERIKEGDFRADNVYPDSRDGCSIVTETIGKAISVPYRNNTKLEGVKIDVQSENGPDIDKVEEPEAQMVKNCNDERIIPEVFDPIRGPVLPEKGQQEDVIPKDDCEETPQNIVNEIVDFHKKYDPNINPKHADIAQESHECQSQVKCQGADNISEKYAMEVGDYPIAKDDKPITNIPGFQNEEFTEATNPTDMFEGLRSGKTSKDDLYTELHGSKADINESGSSTPTTETDTDVAELTDSPTPFMKSVHDYDEERDKVSDILHSGLPIYSNDTVSLRRRRMKNRSQSLITEAEAVEAEKDENVPQRMSFQTVASVVNRRTVWRQKRRKFGMTFNKDDQPIIKEEGNQQDQDQNQSKQNQNDDIESEDVSEVMAAIFRNIIQVISLDYNPSSTNETIVKFCIFALPLIIIPAVLAYIIILT